MAEHNVTPNSVALAFGPRLANSQAFDALFREGMALVEETAGYLDGDGRKDSRQLDRGAALSYATESMRLTTRLMQLASWLLLQRAVNAGELTQEQAARETSKVKLASLGHATPPETLALLPQRLQDLITQTLRLQERVLQMDKMIYQGEQVQSSEAQPQVHQHLAALQSAFGTKPDA